MTEVGHVVDQLYRRHFGRMVATLLRFSRSLDPAAAEDIVHDTFSAALASWSVKGVPLSTSGWLYKVCRNKALNRVRRDNRSTEFEDHLLAAPDNSFSDSAVEDQDLRMLFACAHPALAPKAQVVITLKYVANLRIEAIANVLGITVDGVDKILSRARHRIKDEKLLLDEPPQSMLESRLSTVHKVIYLIFNEGYKPSTGKTDIRKELCEDALLLNRALLDSKFGNHDTAALQSLMVFNSARFDSRFGAGGELIELEYQDRLKWDHNLIMLGQTLLDQSRTESISTYHIEASIACLHCTADRFTNTNWELIAKLYARLLNNNPNPFVELNYGIALYYDGKKVQAFKILLDLTKDPYLSRYFLLNSALGKLYLLEGELLLAGRYLSIAYGQAESEQERLLIRKRLELIGPELPNPR